jgi:hypothetical protein
MSCALATQKFPSLIDVWVALGKSKISENFNLNVQIWLIDHVQNVFCSHGAIGSGPID